MAKKPGFSDIADLPENKRIELIGAHANVPGKIIAFIVEDDAKADRYVKKIRNRYPNVIELDRHPNVPIDGVITVRVGLPQSEN